MSAYQENLKTELCGLRRELKQLIAHANEWRAHHQNVTAADPYEAHVKRLRHRIAETEARCF